MRHLAGEGRTVFLSSHLMSEMALTADHLIVVGRGRVVADAPAAEIIDRAGAVAVRVRSPQAGRLADALARAGTTVTSVDAQTLQVAGSTTEQVGDVAAATGVVLHELTPLARSLEEAYMDLTADEVEYHSVPSPAGVAAPVPVGSFVAPLERL